MKKRIVETPEPQQVDIPRLEDDAALQAARKTLAEIRKKRAENAAAILVAEAGDLSTAAVDTVDNAARALMGDDPAESNAYAGLCEQAAILRRAEDMAIQRANRAQEDAAKKLAAYHGPAHREHLQAIFEAFLQLRAALQAEHDWRDARAREGFGGAHFRTPALYTVNGPTLHRIRISDPQLTRDILRLDR